MIKKMLLIIMGFFSISCNIFCDIVNTKVLKDPRSKKIVVLYGDDHPLLDASSKKQADHIICQIQKLSNKSYFKNKETCVFFEGCCACSPFIMGDFKKINCFCQHIGSANSLLEMLMDRSNPLSFNFIDNLINIEARTFNDIQEFLEIKHKLFLLKNDNNLDDLQKNEIPLFAQIQEWFINEDIRFHQEDVTLLIMLFKSILNTILKLQEMNKNLPDGITKNIIESEIKQLKLKLYEIEKKIDRIGIKLETNKLIQMYSPILISQEILSICRESENFEQLLDLNCLFEILNRANMKKAIVFAGFGHTHNIANYLIKFGFQKIYDSFENSKNSELKDACLAASEGGSLLNIEDSIEAAIKNSDRSFSDFDYILCNDLMESNEEITQMEIDDYSNFAENKSTKRKREQFEEDKS